MSPVEPRGDGRYQLRLDARDRELVGALCAELEALIQADDRKIPRLFPPAHRSDPETAAAFDRLARDELVAGRLAALATVRRTLLSETLEHDELTAWCGALNDLRLVLGDRLGVTEDMHESLFAMSPDHALYAWLTWLQAATVDALAARL